MGYGFLIPVFFVTSGLRLDLGGLFDSPSAMARVPVFVLALLVVRGVPALLFARTFDRRSVAAAALLQATSLPFIVTATQIGVLTGLMTPVTAAALICAGLVSVIAFPTLALSLLRRPRAVTVPPERSPSPTATRSGRTTWPLKRITWPLAELTDVAAAEGGEADGGEDGSNGGQPQEGDHAARVESGRRQLGDVVVRRDLRDPVRQPQQRAHEADDDTAAEHRPGDHPRPAGRPVRNRRPRPQRAPRRRGPE